MYPQCEYCAVDGFYGQLLHETEYWLIYLAPSQRYLGTCVVVLKRICRDLNQLKPEEWTDFAEIVNVLENVLYDTLKPTLFNWSCFKNSAFRLENPKPEVHWHFIPRYKDSLKFDGMSFTDPDFGYIPQPIEHKIPPKTTFKLKEILKNQIINSYY